MSENQAEQGGYVTKTAVQLLTFLAVTEHVVVHSGNLLLGLHQHLCGQTSFPAPPEQHIPRNSNTIHNTELDKLLQRLHGDEEP